MSGRPGIKTRGFYTRRHIFVDGAMRQSANSFQSCRGANVRKFACLFISVLMVACSQGSGSPDSSVFDVDDAVAVDIADSGLIDLSGPDLVEDRTAIDLEDPDSVDVDDVETPDAEEVDAADAADVMDAGTDDGPQVPWYQQLAPSGQKVREIFGVASHMETSEAGDPETEFEFDTYQGIGGLRARRGFRWSNVEPEEGVFLWEKTNGAVVRSVEHGVNLMPVVYYGNDWAESDPDKYGTLDVSKYANYAGAMATQYCDSIKEYELWNEQNITRFWHLPPDPAKYAEMVVAASLKIKAACPDASVVFGGMASYDDVDMFDTWNFLRRSLQARPDLCDYFDGVALHPYTFLQFDSPEYDEIDFGFRKPGQTMQTDIARQMLADAGCGEKGIYYTELGWPTYDLSRETVATYAVRSMLLAARDGVTGWYWYTFYDDDPSDSNPIRPHENHFGLFEWAGNAEPWNFTPKPAWTMLVSMLDMVGPFRFAAEVSRIMDLPDDVYVLAFVTDDDILTLAMWDGRDQPDVTYGKSAPGGPGTTFDLLLELPDDTVNTVLFDQAGSQTELPGTGPLIEVTLTPQVQYLYIDRGVTI